MSNILSGSEGFYFLALFWLTSLAAIRLLFRKRTSTASFLVSERSVGLLLGITTVAVSWVWAPAFFVSSQKAYEQGIPGLFWFTFPNAGAVIIFAFLADRMRKIFDKGYTLPEFMGRRFGKRMEILYSFSIFIVQSYSIILNLTAALLMLNLVTGMAKGTLIIILGLMMISLSLIKGIRSSLIQDAIKATLIAVVGVIIVPWTIAAGGGFSMIQNGLGGIKGTFTNLFDPMVAWTFGVPFSISLLSAVVIDQQQWQRAFSIKKSVVKSSFLLGGLVFAVVPLSLGLLGFIASNQSLGILVKQNQLVGFYTVFHFLPQIAVLAFTAMVLAGLVAVGSAALNAVSSIGAADIYRMVKPNASDQDLVMASRLSMIVLIVLGMSIALIPNIQLLYLVLVVGAFRGALFVPTILSLYWGKLSYSLTFLGIIIGMLIGVPLFVYGSLVKNATISSFGSLVPVVITLIFCIIGGIRKAESFDFRALSGNKNSK